MGSWARVMGDCGRIGYGFLIRGFYIFVLETGRISYTYP